MNQSSPLSLPDIIFDVTSGVEVTSLNLTADQVKEFWWNSRTKPHLQRNVIVQARQTSGSNILIGFNKRLTGTYTTCANADFELVPGDSINSLWYVEAVQYISLLSESGHTAGTQYILQGQDHHTVL